MATSGSDPMFLKAVNCFGEVKDKYFIANLMKEVIHEVGRQNVVQVITDNAANCKGAGELIEMEFPHIYWTPCVVHTLNLALKNIFAAKNVSGNEVAYDACSWLANLLKLLRRGLQAMVISDDWSSYKEDEPGKAGKLKEVILLDMWWDTIDYVIDFTNPIYDMIRYCDTDKPCLHLVYEMWDSMIKKVKITIFKYEELPLTGTSKFFDVVYEILIARWTKSNTPLHCLAHSLNPSDEWLVKDSSRVAPHRDGEISRERMRCFRRLFPLADDLSKAMDEYALFSMKGGPFEDLTIMSKMATMEPKSWWANSGAETPLLQTLAFKLLGSPLPLLVVSGIGVHTTSFTHLEGTN
uniref:DUF659 domain-containing protein n=1 Tax=Chenopodium quinoa TaxID=63459 RepID=A0A803MM66_CHEQI